jgi:hypothetical protein
MTLQSPTPPQSGPWTTPPTPMHLEQLAAARRRSTKIRRAIATATFSAWTTALFAGLTMLCSVTSPLGFALGAGMAVVSYVEFKGVGHLKRLDRAAPTWMAKNQIVFGVILFLYGAISLWQSLNAPLPPEVMSDPLVAQAYGRDLGELSKLIYTAVYGSVMLAAILGPGLTALYYRTRVRFIDEYLKETPQWILDLQRAGMNV